MIRTTLTLTVILAAYVGGGAYVGAKFLEVASWWAAALAGITFCLWLFAAFVAACLVDHLRRSRP